MTISTTTHSTVIFLLLWIVTLTTSFTIPISNHKLKQTCVGFDDSYHLLKRTLFSSKNYMRYSASLHLSPMEAWEGYNNALNSDPLLTKSITAGILLGAADLSGQVFENSTNDNNKNKEVDVSRTIRFAIFGLILQAPWNHYYYMLLDGQIPPTPDEPFSSTNIVKVCIDQFIQAPIFTVLIFVFLGLLEGKALSSIKQQLDSDYKETIIANWKLWVPATIINIGFIPPLFRVLYLNIVFFFWSIYLSLIVNKDQKSS